MTPTAEILSRVDRGNLYARVTMRAILILDGYMGVAWLGGDPNRTQLGIFLPPRRLLDGVGIEPSRLWGGLLLLLAVVAFFAMEGHSELFTRLAIAALGGYWTFWVVLDIVAAFAVHGSLTAWAGASVIVVGHVRGCVGVNLLTRRAVKGI